MLSFLHHPKTNAASFKPNANRRPKYVLLLLLPFFAILAQAPFVGVWGQLGIILNVPLPRTICSSDDAQTVFLRFKVVSGQFNPGNVFTAELSDAFGVFDDANPTTIGTLAGVSSGIIRTAIQPGTEAGIGYLMRITCSDPIYKSDPIAFGIRTVDAPTLTLTKRDVSSCGGGSDGVITGNPSGGAGSYTFILINDLLESFPVDPNDPTVTNLPPGNYFMRMDDNNRCAVVQTTTLVTMPAPTITVSTLGNTSACRDIDDGFFTLRVFPRTGTTATAIKPYSFTLTPAAGTFTPEPSAPYKFSNLPQGDYTVTITDGAGCASDLLLPVTIGKDSPLVVNLSGYGNPTTCGGTNGDITVLNTGGSGSTYRYSISKDGGAYSTPQSGRRFGGLAAGNYIVEGMDSRGCTDTLHKTLTSPKGCTFAVAGSTDGLSAATALNALKLQALPNPSRTTFTLNLQGGSKENVQIIVTDMVGKKIYQTAGSSNQQYTFGQEFKSGIYIVQVIQGKQIQTLKLVKTN